MGVYRSSCTTFVSEYWLLETFIQQPYLSGLLIFLFALLSTQHRLFVLQCLVILFVYPSPPFITFSFAKCGLLNSSSKQSNSTPIFNPQDSICGICTKYKLDAFILDTKLYFFHILLKKMQVVATLRPIILGICFKHRKSQTLNGSFK